MSVHVIMSEFISNVSLKGPHRACVVDRLDDTIN